MRILALDAASARASVGVVVESSLVASRIATEARGAAMRLAVLADEVLAAAGLRPGSLDMIAVTVGPGSFTGIRAALALAHGIGLAAQVPVIGVTVGEALASSLPALGGRSLWAATDSRRSRVFLEHDGVVEAVALEALPRPGRPVAVAGDAAVAVAARLAARGDDVMLTDARLPLIRHVAMAGAARADGRLTPLPAQPLYVDPPEVRLPQSGLRPPPTMPA